MNLILIGGVHHTLTCQEKLNEIFSKYRKSHPSPQFVAVEYNEEIFNTFIISQRSAGELCKKKIK